MAASAELAAERGDGASVPDLTKDQGNGVNAQIRSSAEWEALHKFDAENNVVPLIAIAERIALKHGLLWGSPEYWALVDDIHSAIESAIDIATQRAPLEAAAIGSLR